MTGTALLYVCYNNTKFTLKKKQRQHRRFMRNQKKMQNDQMGDNLTTQQDGSEASRPSYGTATINSILMNRNSPTNNTDKTKPQIVQNGLMKEGQQQHLFFQFGNGSSNYNKNRQTQNIFNKQERQYLSNSDSDESDDSDYYEEKEYQNYNYNNYNSNKQCITYSQNQNQNYHNYHYKPQEAVGNRDLTI
eukprot:403365537